MNGFKCFLASSSASGFVSHFGDCYCPEDGWRTYIIKGGPGTGKSSFMKRVLKKIHEKEYCIEVYCASDPHSLDGLILPDSKRVFMDGTSPHVVEPKFPGVCETLLDFGAFWDASVLREKCDEIISATKENKACHKRAAYHIKNAGNLFPQTAISRSAGAELISKHIPEKGGTGRFTKAFLGGITPDGVKYFDKTIEAGTTVIVGGKDCDGVLKNMQESAIKKGVSGYLFENPVLPSLTDAVFIPELSFFAVKESFIPADREIAKHLELAAGEIAKAKDIHDKLEGFYISAMDYDAVDSFTEDFLKGFR